MSEKVAPRLIVVALALLLAGCATFETDEALQAQSLASADAEPEAPANGRAANAPEKSGDVPKGDLLAQARALAAAKGVGEPPGAQEAARAALAVAAAARPAVAPQPSPAAPPDLEDVNARIKLAALRLRAQADSAQTHPAEALRAAGPAEDPREIFRRARERHMAEQARAARVFGDLSPQLTLAPTLEPAPHDLVEALRRKEAARADDAVVSLAR